MGEKVAIARLKRIHTKAVFERVENSSATGMPDSTAVDDGNEVWIECKEVDSMMLRETSPCKPKIRPSQFAWIVRNVIAGRQVYVSIVTPGKGPWWIVPGNYIDLLRNGVTRKWLEIHSINPGLLFTNKISRDIVRFQKESDNEHLRPQPRPLEGR